MCFCVLQISHVILLIPSHIKTALLQRCRIYRRNGHIIVLTSTVTDIVFLKFIVSIFKFCKNIVYRVI